MAEYSSTITVFLYLKKVITRGWDCDRMQSLLRYKTNNIKFHYGKCKQTTNNLEQSYIKISNIMDHTASLWYVLFAFAKMNTTKGN